jgi:beta-N-acetylhexosaminidase
LNARACIFGCQGLTLSKAEQRFFAQANPWGFILFARNCQSEAQISALCDALRDCVGRHAPIFIDEEGGRVSRLRSLGGRIGPPADVFARSGLSLGDQGAAVRANYRAIGARLASMGIDVDCAPVLDLPTSKADPIIGDRAFSDEPAKAAFLAKSCLAGLHDAGVSGVIKHIPGHGRAEVDSHKALPIVEADREVLQAHDFAPFMACKAAGMAMTAHVIYTAYDRQNAATCSQSVIKEVIRGRIGFDGLLMSDDLDMQALCGSLAERTRLALAAGCDVVLHCNGVLESMNAVAGAAPILSGSALDRAHAARAKASRTPVDRQQAEHEADVWLEKINRGTA